MGSISPELSLDFKPAYVSTTITGFLTELKKIGNVSEKLSKLDDYVMKLEEEMRKIDAFKRELPLCMLLLNDAIVALKEETTQCRIQPIMEEFIPSKKNTDEDGHGEMKKEKDCRDKKNWMSSVQLWTSNDFPSNRKQKQVMEMIEGHEEDDRTATENPFELCRHKNGGGAFMPFKGCSSFPASAGKKDKEEVSVPGLSLLIPGAKNLRSEGSSSSLKVKNNGTEGTVQSNLQLMNSHQQRKARRCWSPELHRRFVGALQQLGGSQAATPKQIRELMRVDGLTNDEVKSHLQKYRLHTRRVPVGAAAAHADQPVVVFRGLWMPQDQYGSSSKPSNSQSGSPQGPLQLAGTAGGVSTTGGDSMEDEEDEKSESYSWKGHGHKGEEEDV